MSISGKFKELYNVNSLNEVFIPSKSREAKKVIEELATIAWSKGKKSQREACKRFNELADSDEPISNKFLKKIDAATTTIGEALLKSSNCEEDDEDSDDEQYEYYNRKVNK